ncbi:MAG: hypothetical protein ACHQU0_02770 [Candidatus Paceibacteria bacterium]
MSSRKERWIKDIPRSRMEYPTRFFDQIKYWFWIVYTHFYPAIRRVAYHLGIGEFFINYFEGGSKGRQNFLIGTLAPERSARDCAFFLVENGYGNHFVAWKDRGEIASLRKTVGFEYQYHVRIFDDGEIRCHYEYTPECHPFLHMIQAKFEDRSPEFKELLKDWIVPACDSVPSEA